MHPRDQAWLIFKVKQGSEPSLTGSRAEHVRLASAADALRVSSALALNLKFMRSLPFVPKTHLPTLFLAWLASAFEQSVASLCCTVDSTSPLTSFVFALPLACSPARRKDSRGSKPAKHAFELLHCLDATAESLYLTLASTPLFVSRTSVVSG